MWDPPLLIHSTFPVHVHRVRVPLTPTRGPLAGPRTHCAGRALGGLSSLCAKPLVPLVVGPHEEYSFPLKRNSFFLLF